MTSLPMRTEMTHYVDFNDLEDFVSTIFGVRPTIVSMEECGNDATLHFNIDGGGYSWDVEIFQEFINTGFAFGATRVILNALAKDGYIPTGNYNIEVSW